MTDFYARRVVGWRQCSPIWINFVLAAWEKALYDRHPEGIDTLNHQSDRKSQQVSIGYSERLAAAGIESSVGRRGDYYDNPLAKTINDL